jgi:hypothetical protein
VEIIFEVTEDPIDGGFVASALGHGITTETDTLSDLREMVKDAVQCHFRDAEQMPQLGSRSAANGTGRKNGVVIIWKTMPP